MTNLPDRTFLTEKAFMMKSPSDKKAVDISFALWVYYSRIFQDVKQPYKSWGYSTA
jgi:hypothetical protein